MKFQGNTPTEDKVAVASTIALILSTTATELEKLPVKYRAIALAEIVEQYNQKLGATTQDL